MGASYTQPQKVVQYSAICIDMNIKLLMQNFLQFLKPDDRDYMYNQLCNIFLQNQEKEDLLVTLSVRTAFDALLQEMNYPMGSEIICSAINIPQMAKIIRFHGLIPIPVEVDVETLSPKIEDIEGAITYKTKAILISALFGANILGLEKIAESCKRHNLLLIEDLAEGFQNTNYNGHKCADISFFSFGTIKSLSALGGALTVKFLDRLIVFQVIRNQNKLATKIKERINSYPIASNSFYLKKCLKAILAIFCLQGPIIQRYKLMGYKFGFDHQEFVVSLVRGFNVKPEEFLQTFRKQIPSPMMAMLLLRLKQFDIEKMQNIIEKQVAGQDLLTKHGVLVPGYKVQNRNFWLYPIVVDDKKLVQKMLLSRGIEAYFGATQLDIIESPLGKGKFPSKTQEFFDNILYLPINQLVPHQQILFICREVIETVNKLKKMKEGQAIAKL